MLQKLLIAFCTIFVLSACGGDSDDSAPETQDPPQDQPADEDDDTGDDSDAGDDDNTDDDDTGDDSTDGDDDETGPWVNITFDAATDVDSWSSVCVSTDCNATVVLEHNADAAALDVTPEWLGASDQLEVSTTIDPEIADLTGGHAHLHLYVPAASTTAGDMVVQVFFQDASDRKAYIGYRTAATGWNKFYFEDIQLGTGDNDPFGFFNDGFDLTNINRMGVQLQGAEGLVGIEATLHIDDVIVSPEAITVDEKPSEPVVLEPLATGDESFTFDSDVQGWSSDNSAGSSVSHDADAAALAITPDWANGDEGGNRPKAMGITTNVISQASVRMIVTLTEAQVDGGIGIQPYIQQNSGSYSQAFGPIITDNLVAGDNLVTYEAAELADAMRIGVQLVGPITEGESDVVLIKQVEIDLPEGSVEEPTNEISVDMTSGWRVNPDTITWEYTAEGVSYQPTAANDQLVFDPAGPLDMRGGSIDFVYEVDQAFIESGANLQPFFQLKDYASYDYVFCWIGNDSLATGEQTFTCDVPATLENGSDAQIPDGQTAQAGVQTNGGGAGTVIIKSVTINPAPAE